MIQERIVVEGLEKSRSACLAAGIYQIRVKTTASNFKSAEQRITLTAPISIDSVISPNTGSYDKKTSAQADVATTMMLNGNTLVGIHNGAAALIFGSDYTVTGNTVTILQSYLAAQPEGITSLTFTFSTGSDRTLAITVSDTTQPGYKVTYSSNGATSDKILAINGIIGFYGGIRCRCW